MPDASLILSVIQERLKIHRTRIEELDDAASKEQRRYVWWRQHGLLQMLEKEKTKALSAIGELERLAERLARDRCAENFITDPGADSNRCARSSGAQDASGPIL